MKTTDAEKMFLTSLAKNIVSVLGGKIYSTQGKDGFVLERTNKIDNIFQRLEIKKTQSKMTKETFFYLEIVVGELKSHKVLNHVRLKDIKNLYVTLPNLLTGEEKKATFLTVESDRFTIVDFQDRFRIRMLNGIDKRGDEPPGTTHAERREFVEL